MKIIVNEEINYLIKKTKEIVLEEVEKIKNNTSSFDRAILIVPDNLREETEKEMNLLFPSGVISFEVLSLNMLTNRILKESKFKEKVLIDSFTRNIIIRDIIIELKKEKKLHIFNDELESEIIANEILLLIQNNVKATELEKYISSIKENIKKDIDDLCINKLKDICNIYIKYLEKIEELNQTFVKENVLLDIFKKEISKKDYFRKALVIFLGFAELNKLDVFKIGSIVKNAKESIYMLNSFEEKNEDNKKYNANIFKLNEKILNDIVSENNIKIEYEKDYLKENTKDIFMHILDNFRGKRKSCQLEKNIKVEGSKTSNYILNEENSKLSVLNFMCATDEIERVAQDILEKIRNGYTYNDIKVITECDSNYIEKIYEIFESYGLNVKKETTKRIMNTYIMKYIVYSLKIIDKKESLDILSFIKLGFLDLNIKEINVLENYVKYWNINGELWSKDFPELVKGENILQKKVINYIKNLENVFLCENETDISIIKLNIKQFAKSIYTIIEKNKILGKQKEIEGEQYKVLDIFDKYLARLNDIYSDRKFSISEFISILETSFKNKNINICKDEKDLQGIVINKIDDIFYSKNFIYFLGADDILVPYIKNEQSVFTDEEIKILNSKIRKTRNEKEEKLIQAEYNIYKVFSCIKKELFFSSHKKSLNNEEKNESIYFKKLENITDKFINNMKLTEIDKAGDIKEDENCVYLEYLSSEELEKRIKSKKYDYSINESYLNLKEIAKEELSSILRDKRSINDDFKNRLDEDILAMLSLDKELKDFEKAIFFENKEENINKVILDELNNDKSLSISKLEAYAKCPFMYYVKYYINPKEIKENIVQNIDTGIFIHEFFEVFVQTLKKDYTQKQLFENLPNKHFIDILKDDLFTEIEDFNKYKNKVNILVNDIFSKLLKKDEYKIFLSNNKNVILTDNLISLIKKSVLYFLETIRLSNFELFKEEFEFSSNMNEYIDFEKNKNVILKGKIDRIDIIRKENKNYFRIIDYKSSKHEINFIDLFNGINMQMPIYSLALEHELNKENNTKNIASGLYYFAVNDVKIKGENKRRDNVELLNEISKKRKMTGLILDEQTINDNDITAILMGKSLLVPLEIKKDGTFSSRTRYLSDEKKEEFNNLLKETISYFVNEMEKGDISIKPYKTTLNRVPCDYCKYKDICSIDTDNRNYYRKSRKIFNFSIK